MTRDMDLVRNILLRLEKVPFEEESMVPIDSPIFAGLNADTAKLEYHLKLLIDHGLVISRSKNHPSIGFLFQGLSWAGHDLVDSVRSDDIWQKTKAGAQRAGGWTMDLMLDFAKAIIKHELGKYLPGA